MALDFPANPTDGQIYETYIYSSASGVWKSTPSSATVSVVSPTKPFTANAGDIWVDSSDGVAYFYYDDGTSFQWVEMMSSGVPSLALKADKTYVDSQDSTKAPLSHAHAATDITSGTLSRTRLPSANWAISNGNAVTVNSTTPTVIASLSITTRGNPIFLCGTGDMNPQGAATWNYIRIFRDSTPIGKFIICESTANSVNNPFALTHIDTPSAGTYTYTIRAYRGGAYDALYGETSNEQAPQLIAFELF